MRKFIGFVLLALLAGGRLAAQTPDEEFYPYEERYEPYQPMLTTDPALFFRAIHTAGDLYGEGTAFRFYSLTSYNRRGEPYCAENLLLGPVLLPGRYASMLRTLHNNRSDDGRKLWTPSGAVELRTFGATDEELLPTHHLSLRLTDRNYLAGLQMFVAESPGRGWEIEAALQGRTGRDLHVEGVFTNALNIGVRAVKRFRADQSLTLLAVASPSMRGLRSSSVQEAYDLTGNPYYNPSWGFQNGRVRSGRIRREWVPLLAALFTTPLTDRTRLDATVAAEAGDRRYSALAWYGAPTPMPDNYRYLPSYQTDPAAARSLEEVWRADNERYTQIDWEELYAQNRLGDGTSAYAVEDRVERIVNAHVAAQATTALSDRLTLAYGVRFARKQSRYFKQMRDLLGGDRIVDLDQYLIDDDTYSNLLQNDLQHPDRVIREGDRFGYDYDLVRTEWGAGGTVEYGTGRLYVHGTAQIQEHRIHRRGRYEKELFPGERSLGRSRTLNFTPYYLRAAVGWSVTPRHLLEAVLETSARAPESDDLFLNPQYNNRAIDAPTTEKRYAAELNYVQTGRVLELKVSLFAVRTDDGVAVTRYYDDLSHTFSDLVTSNIATLRHGIEAAARLYLSRRWQLTLAAATGSYRYAENPFLTIYADTDNAVIDNYAESYMGDCHVGRTPQTTASASVNYYGPKGWGFRVDGAYATGRSVDPSPLRRTLRVARQLPESPEAFDLFTRQERLGDAFTLDLALFKSFYFKSSRLTLMLSVRNLLNQKDMVYSGYESHRIRTFRAGDTQIHRPHANRYLYAYPRSFFFSATWKF